MDRSRAYIGMCGRAQEIQRLWAQSYGDFFVGENQRVTCWIRDHNHTTKIKSGFRVTTRENIIRICRYVWLPRLDQLIEMAQIPGRRYESVTQDFFDWSKRSYADIAPKPGNVFNSLEQLWLGFVMQQKFGRNWQRARWRKIESPRFNPDVDPRTGPNLDPGADPGCDSA